MLAAYGVHWFEEPLDPDNLHDYVLLRNTSPVPIAGGEVLTRRQSFAPWLQQRAFDIVQPDATKVGGISEERRIAWMAEENGVRFIPHGWNTALGLAADLHLASASRKTDMVEYLMGSPFIDDLVADLGNWTATACWRSRTAPDWEWSSNMDAVEKHTGERFHAARAGNDMATPVRTVHDLPRRLGMLDATAIVVGIVIGSGIFVLPNVIARSVPSYSGIIAAWVIGGVLSFFGALAYAELGAMLPATGGQYVYLREAYGPLWRSFAGGHSCWRCWRAEARGWRSRSRFMRAILCR